MSNFVQYYPCFWELDKIGQKKLDKIGQNWTLLDKIGQKLGKFLELFSTSPTDFFEKKVGQNWTKLDKIGQKLGKISYPFRTLIEPSRTF